MKKILFVCNGNVFRSMSAEKCLNHYLRENSISDIVADSAGVNENPQEISNFSHERLKFHGINSDHRWKTLSRELIDDSDLVIAMNFDQKNHIKEKYGIDVPLFNQVAHNEIEGVLDVEDLYPDKESFGDRDVKEVVREYMYSVVDHIYDSTPDLYKNLRKWM